MGSTKFKDTRNQQITSLPEEAVQPCETFWQIQLIPQIGRPGEPVAELGAAPLCWGHSQPMLVGWTESSWYRSLWHGPGFLWWRWVMGGREGNVLYCGGWGLKKSKPGDLWRLLYWQPCFQLELVRNAPETELLAKITDHSKVRSYFQNQRDHATDAQRGRKETKPYGVHIIGLIRVENVMEKACP